MTDVSKDSGQWLALTILDRPHLNRLHTLQHGAPCVAKPKLGGSMIGWACDEIDALRAQAARLAEALRPFADCCEQIANDESDEEWAKFRLLVSDYRRAREALK